MSKIISLDDMRYRPLVYIVKRGGKKVSLGNKLVILFQYRRMKVWSNLFLFKFDKTVLHEHSRYTWEHNIKYLETELQLKWDQSYIDFITSLFPIACWKSLNTINYLWLYMHKIYEYIYSQNLKIVKRNRLINQIFIKKIN